MKRLLLTFAVLSAAFSLNAQDFKTKYDVLVKNVGYGGVGIETYLAKWEAARSDDPELYRAKFNFFLTKSLSRKVVTKESKRYLGNAPVVSLKDSTGKPVNYFEINEFNDSLFTLCIKAVDRAVALAPDELGYRVDKITALMDYGIESPDLAASELSALIDYNRSAAPAWKFNGAPVKEDDFLYLVQEYCTNFYKLGTPQSLESFRAVSEKMFKLYPGHSEFLSNIGSYWLIAKKNYKKAASCYKKALKINKDDAAAKRNLQIVGRLQKKKA